MNAATSVATCAIIDPVAGLLERIDAAITHAKSVDPTTSARRIALRAGLSGGYFGKTRGDLKRDPDYDPGAATIQKIANACGVRAEWLASGEDPMLPERFPAAPAHLLLRDENDAWTLAQFLEGFAWPEDLLPQDADEVIRRVRSEFSKASEPIPQSYWHMRIKRLIGEVRRASEAVELGLKQIDERKAAAGRAVPRVVSGKRVTKAGRE